MDDSYIAGFFDGEGCALISVSKHPDCIYGYQLQPRIHIYNNKREVLEKIKDYLGYGKISEHQNKDQKKSYQFYIYNRENIRDFIFRMIDLVIVKKPQLLYMADSLKIFQDSSGNLGKRYTEEEFNALIDCASKIRSFNDRANQPATNLEEIKIKRGN